MDNTKSEVINMSDTKPILVKLKTPVTFAVDGHTDQTYEADVCCHNSTAFRAALFFRNAFTKAYMEMARRERASANNANIPVEDEPEDKNESNIIPVDTVRVVLATADIDMEAMLDRFDKLMFMGVVRVANPDGKPVNFKQLAELDPEDIETLMVVYISNFITPLVMKALTSST